ncbi:MAG: helix-turn-helix domain-containing protein [Chitinispirillales bacterium]|jgi:cytoskeletal protein RodZ|nr:helix-turn-helix domain-containing protein [Chitinispirillales bacterium]
MAEKNSERKETANTAEAGKDTVKDAGAGKDAVKETVKDKVGDILRKERLTRRITIDTIAKDLKLNMGYIKALEASDYDSLPPDPYIRVYIRSLTKYLSLDAESILKEFYKERGLIVDDSVQAQASKIDVSVQRQDKNPAVIVIAALIVILAVFAFIANKKGWINQPDDAAATTVEKQDSNVSAMTDHDAVSQKITDSIEEARQAALQKELKEAATTPAAGPTKQLKKQP